jgi:hypothetical protein
VAVGVPAADRQGGVVKVPPAGTGNKMIKLTGKVKDPFTVPQVKMYQFAEIEP